MRQNVAAFLRRNSLVIAAVVIIAAFMGILLLLAASDAKLQQQVEAQQQILTEVQDIADQIAKAASQRTEQINGIDRHLDCIVLFFTEEDRANRKITDIDTCTLQDTRNGTILQQGAASFIPTTPQSTNSGAVSPQNTTSGGVAQSTPTPTPVTPEPAPEAPQSPGFFTQVNNNVIKPVTDFLGGLLGVQ